MVRLLIIGLGLIGGSLGLALQGNPRFRATGYARRPEVAARARAIGAVTQVAPDLSQAAGEADIIIIATHILAVREILETIAPHLQPNTVVTDTSSTKEQVMAWARAILPPGVSFVGGHPMAGKETWGLEAAEPGLFRDCTYCIVPGEAPEQAVRQVQDLALAVRARPCLVNAAEHDRMVAGISHLPLVLAAALVEAATKDPAWTEMGALAAGGFRDTTRVASGSPEMGRDICLTNRVYLQEWLDRFQAGIEGFRRSLALSDGPGLERRFREAREAREAWHQARYG